MTKKTLAFVVYPGISLLELVGSRTFIAPLYTTKACRLTRQEGKAITALKAKYRNSK